MLELQQGGLIHQPEPFADLELKHRNARLRGQTMPALVDQLYVALYIAAIDARVDAEVLLVIMNPASLAFPARVGYLLLAKAGRSDHDPGKVAITVVAPVDYLIGRILRQERPRHSGSILFGSIGRRLRGPRKIKGDIRRAKYQRINQLLAKKLSQGGAL